MKIGVVILIKNIIQIKVILLWYISCSKLQTTILDLTHHHPSPQGGVGSAASGLSGSGHNVLNNPSTVLGDLEVQDLLLDRAPSPTSARMPYGSDKHPKT